jgi:hypothetical protein
MSASKVSVEEIQVFIETLKSIGLSIRKFCDRAASEEYNLTDKEITSKSEAYRKRFIRESISEFEFKIFQDILYKQPEFIKSNMVSVIRKKDTFENKAFESSMFSAFKSLK